MDIGSLTGAVAIEDQVSDNLTLMANKVKAFADSFDGMVGIAVMGGAAIAGAIAGAVVSITALGDRGSDVNDVAATFENFAGSVSNATKILENMRAGTLGTVADFDLMKSSSKLLAAGVNLTAENFKTLTETAFVLQNQGLGPTKDMLDLVSQAMLSGNLRSLKRIGIHIDLKKAEAEYAESIGTTADQLNEAGKLEAKRFGLLEAFNKKVKEAGDQQRDFGEQLEFASATLASWYDKLAGAVASSADVKKALDTIGKALADAFNSESQSIMDAIVSSVNWFARAVTNAVPYVVSFFEILKSTWEFLRQYDEEFKTVALAIGIYTLGIYAAEAAMWGLTAATKAYQAIAGASSFLGKINPVTLALAAAALAAAELSRRYMKLRDDTATLTEASNLLSKSIINVGVAHSILDAYEAGKRGEQLKDVAITLDMAEAWNKGRLAIEKNTQALQGNASAAADLAKFQKTGKLTIPGLGPAKPDGLEAPPPPDISRFLKDQVGAAQGWADTMRKLQDQVLAAQQDNDLKSYTLQMAKLNTAEKNEIDSYTRQWQAKEITHTQMEQADLLITQRYDELRKGIGAKAAEEYKKTLESMSDDLHTFLQKRAEATLADTKAADAAAVKASNEMYDLRKAAAAKYHSQVADLSLNSRKLEIKHIEAGRDAAIAALQVEKFGRTETTDAAIQDINRIAAAEIKLANEKPLVIYWNEAGDAVAEYYRQVEIAKTLNEELIDDLKQISGMVVSAFTGGGGVMGALKGIGSMVGSTIGKSIGATIGMLGSLGGPIGAAIGSLAGPLIGMIGGLFTHAGRDVKNKFLDAMGGEAALKAQLAPLGEEMARELWSAFKGASRDDPTHAQAAIENITKALDRQKQIVADLNSEIDDTRAKIAALGGDGTPSIDMLTAAAERLGISTDALGQSFHDARSAADWQSVVDDIDMVVRGGADLNTVILAAKDKFNALVSDSTKFGTVIPANAKPWIQTLIDAHQLLDDTGKEITDISTLKFGGDMMTTLEALNLTLKDLVETLRLALPAAAQAGADGVTRAFGGIQWPRPRFGSGGEVPEAEGFASGGIVPSYHGNVVAFRPRGTDTVPAMLTPGERVIPAGGSSGDQGLTIYLDSENITRAVVKRMRTTVVNARATG